VARRRAKGQNTATVAGQYFSSITKVLTNFDTASMDTVEALPTIVMQAVIPSLAHASCKAFRARLPQYLLSRYRATLDAEAQPVKHVKDRLLVTAVANMVGVAAHHPTAALGVFRTLVTAPHAALLFGILANTLKHESRG
jgi:hypothetical protein